MPSCSAAGTELATTLISGVSPELSLAESVSSEPLSHPCQISRLPLDCHCDSGVSSPYRRGVMRRHASGQSLARKGRDATVMRGQQRTTSPDRVDGTRLRQNRRPQAGEGGRLQIDDAARRTTVSAHGPDPGHNSVPSFEWFGQRFT